MRYLSYELCKQLKDVGFPQDFIDGDRFYSRDYEHYKEPLLYSYDDIYGYPEIDNKTIKIPNLSELIEACGEQLESLRRLYTSMAISGEWLAIEKPSLFTDKKKHCSSCECKIKVQGNTPSEAVAKLYIKLNMKV